jgi:hypothetical protein
MQCLVGDGVSQVDELHLQLKTAAAPLCLPLNQETNSGY